MSVQLRARSPAGPGDAGPAGQLLIANALRGLLASPKRLTPVYFYDSIGSALFERICAEPEYYLTRLETRILRDAASEIGRLLGPRCLLVEYGSGASVKTRLLLDRLAHPSAYVPVDVSESALLEAQSALRRDYPFLEILPVCADFTQPFTVPRPSSPAARVAVFFPGSTIGNFDPVDAVRLLRDMRTIAGPGSALVIGVDLVKDIARMEDAYDDRAGVTAEFNLNVLHRLNREFSADFAPDGFEHEAVWVPAGSRIEMRLVSKREQCVHLAGVAIEFAMGERLVTEHCHKYTIESFEILARAAGWSPRHSWTDESRGFSVRYLLAPGH